MAMDKVMRLASENGLVIFSKSSCCLCYTVNILFTEQLGVSPYVHDLDQDHAGKYIEKALIRMGCSAPVPAVFIGGKLVGSTNEVMSLHLSGNLLPLLKPYYSFN